MNKAIAIIVSIERYSIPTIPEVIFAKKDGEGISIVLSELGYKLKDQVCLSDVTATKTTIESSLRKISAYLDTDDTFLLFYAGHGFAKNEKNYITCFDTQLNDLEATSIPIQYIIETIRMSKCKKSMFFFDSCHSGVPLDSSMRELRGDMSEHELHEIFKNSEHSIAFASCKATEKSYSHIKVSHGVWSYHIIQALSGNAKAARKGFLITNNTLQNYLAVEVPKFLRFHRTDRAIQTPVMFGNLTSEFIVANIESILEKKKPKPNPITDLCFRFEESNKIKSLSGFKKSHRVPDEVNEATKGFVATISIPDIDHELNVFFEKIKDSNSYKRKEIEVFKTDGFGSITTPDYSLNISYYQSQTNPDEVIIDRKLESIKDGRIIEDASFNTVFSKTFVSIELEFKSSVDIKDLIDRLEEDDPPYFDIDYPKEYNFVRLISDSFRDFSVIINDRTLIVEKYEASSPKELFDALEYTKGILTDMNKQFLVSRSPDIT